MDAVVMVSHQVPEPSPAPDRPAGLGSRRQASSGVEASLIEQPTPQTLLQLHAEAAA